MIKIEDLEVFKEQLLTCLGGSFPIPCRLDSNIEEFSEHDGYRIEKVSYQVEPKERVSAFVLIPENISSKKPAPAIAIWHQHYNKWEIGKSEPAGIIGDPSQFTGVALAREGFVVICPDALCFEERQDSILKGEEFERYVFLNYLVKGKCLAWKNIFDMKRAIDYLCSRDDVNEDKLGCYGHSLGAMFTWLLGPWEDRIKCFAGNCSLPTYSAIQRTSLLSSFSLFIPGLKKFGDTPNIASLIAPRPFHLNFGAKDRHSPILEVKRGIETIKEAYAVYGCGDNFTYFIDEENGHILSDEMLTIIRNKFLEHLL